MASSLDAAENTIKCESVGPLKFVFFDQQSQDIENSCSVDNNTAISIDDVTFLSTSNYFVDGIHFNSNKRIVFLPVRIYESFPNLRAYFAGNLNISKVSHKNLQRLSKLEILHLNNNRIEKIRSDTFEGLLKLRIVNLGKLFCVLDIFRKNSCLRCFTNSFYSRIQQNSTNEWNAVRWTAGALSGLLVAEPVHQRHIL